MGQTSPSPLRVLLVGAGGKLGRHADALLSGHGDFEVVGRLGRGQVTAQDIAQTGAELGLDMTCAGLGFDHGLALIEAGVRPVIATSGVSPAQTGELDLRARERGMGGLVVPNFSLGLWLLQRAAVEMVRHYGRAEIIETHHPAKRDAPSASALATRQLMDPSSGPGAPGEIPIHSLRLPGVHANQEVIFGGEGEQLRVAHRVQDLGAYDVGILAALGYAKTASGVTCGIEIAFEWSGIRTARLNPGES